MSSNKGKDGEMRVIKIVADIAIQEEGLDLTRPTITNESDMGADLMIQSSPQSLKRLLQVAAGLPQSTDEHSTEQNARKKIKTRVDVKTTQSKLQTDTVDKFASDVHKHPQCDAHILMGGSNLTGPAQRKFDQYKKEFEQTNKKQILAYISNEGISRLESEYSKPITLAPKDD
ncbi:MAG: hypothetical protein NTX45_16330 [Proteobacteria bacterium]|nr:hypothetical protein [Pseudomonadota bacterium]